MNQSQIDECLKAGLPVDSRLCLICAGKVFSLDQTNKLRAIWGLEPLQELPTIQPDRVQRIIRKIGRKPSEHQRPKFVQKPITKKKIVSKRPTNKGPGTELSKLLSTFGIKPKANCSCNLLISTMDSLGPAGCRQNKEKLLGLMRKNQDKYGWGSYLRAGFNAIKTGWVFKLNPLDPLPQLFDEAIRRAEQDQ